MISVKGCNNIESSDTLIDDFSKKSYDSEVKFMISVKSRDMEVKFHNFSKKS